MIVYSFPQSPHSSTTMQYTDLVLLSFVIAMAVKLLVSFISFVFVKSLLIYEHEEISVCSL